MVRKYVTLALCGLLGLAILAACKASQSPVPSPELMITQPSPSLAVEASPTPTAVGETAYPVSTDAIGTIYPAPAGGVETVYPLPPTAYQAAYPGPTETLSPYPEPGGQTPTAYQGPLEPTQAAYPQPTQPGVAYPEPTQPLSPGNTATATATSSISLATPTPTSLPVPTNTPLPTLTSTPTVTPTPALPPPIRSELAASDPELFQIDSGKVQLVEFFAYWCVTCRSMAPTVHSLEALYGNQMNFIYLDIDDPASLQYQKALGYRYQPHFFLLDEDGKILRQWIGWVVPDELRNAIEAALR